MKKSELKSYLREEIIEILSEETVEDINKKKEAYSELNKEVEKTKELTSEAKDSSYDYEDIAQFYLEVNDWPHPVDALNLEVMGIIITDKFYGGNMGEAYNDLMRKADTKGAKFKIGDKVTLNDGGEEMEVVLVRKLMGSKLPSYSVKTSDDEEVEYRETQLKLAESINEGVFLDDIAQQMYSMDYDELSPLEQEVIRDEADKHESLNEEEMDDEEMDKAAAKGAKKGDSISKMANKLGETTREMKSLVRKYKDAVEPEKSELIARLKELTKIKKELESLLQ
tara:strand:- start:1245 stop:2090 length:846 start_codon:yes stop_codon:yes gene_type:complete